MAETASETLGPYKTERLLSSGAQTQVWLAQGPQGQVALKVARTDAHREALARELRAFDAAGPHAHLVRLLDRAGDASWIALEHVRGLPVDRWAQGEDPEDVVGALLGAVEALRHLHAKGVVHGDLKPANVLIDVNNQARLLDLGIASVPGDTLRGFKGTPGYAAPEVLRGERPTAASDVYGLGVTLYAALTGRLPFDTVDPAALAYLPLVSLPEPPNATFPALPGLLSQVVLTMLARDPSRRPSDLAKLGPLLQKAAASPPATPVVGMRSQRDELRRAVVGAADAETRVVVLYGPAGTGRRTLMTEALEAARREGMPWLKDGDPNELLAAVKASKRPPVLALRATANVLGLARSLLDQAIPALLLLHSDRSLPVLTRAVQMTPPPLTRDDVEKLALALGCPVDRAEQLWQDSLGHPIGVVARCKALLRDGRPPADRELPALSRKVLQALRAADELAIPDLATTLGMGEHDLLDQCEVLFAEKLIEAARNGAAIRITAAGRGDDSKAAPE